MCSWNLVLHGAGCSDVCDEVVDIFLARRERRLWCLKAILARNKESITLREFIGICGKSLEFKQLISYGWVAIQDSDEIYCSQWIVQVNGTFLMLGVRSHGATLTTTVVGDVIK